MNIGITVYPTYGGSGIVGSELGKELAARGGALNPPRFRLEERYLGWNGSTARAPFTKRWAKY